MPTIVNMHAHTHASRTVEERARGLLVDLPAVRQIVLMGSAFAKKITVPRQACVSKKSQGLNQQILTHRIFLRSSLTYA